MSTSDDRDQAPAPSPDDDNLLRALIAHASLDVHKALLDLEGDGEDHSEALHTLLGVFAFERTLVLEERDDALPCAVALPSELTGRHWPSCSVLQAVLNGRVMATGPQRPMEWQDVPVDLIAPAQAALCLPIAIR